jgi:hypothetical protein
MNRKQKREQRFQRAGVGRDGRHDPFATQRQALGSATRPGRTADGTAAALKRPAGQR